MGLRGDAGGHPEDALLALLRELRKNILDEGLREDFSREFRSLAQMMAERFGDRPAEDPHRSLAEMLRTASLGLRPDEFTTQRIEALERALLVIGAPRIPQGELVAVMDRLLWAGLLGHGYSGGRRVSVDGKY